MEREIRCVLSLSLGFSFSSPPHASSPASSPFNASFPFLTIFSSSHFPDHWRRFIDAVSRGGENSQTSCCYTGRRDTLIIKGKRTDLIELERLARLGIISISALAVCFACLGRVYSYYGIFLRSCVARKGYWSRIEDVCCEKRKIFEKQDKVKSRIKLSKDQIS